MEKILRIPFTEIDAADLLVDAVYEGGTAKNLGSEVLSKVMHVGNSGGFRKCMKLGENGKKAKDVAYVCIYTTGEEIEWRDEIDRTLYQMCLLAILRLEHADRKKTFEALKSEIENKTP